MRAYDLCEYLTPPWYERTSEALGPPKPDPILPPTSNMSSPPPFDAGTASE